MEGWGVCHVEGPLAFFNVRRLSLPRGKLLIYFRLHCHTQGQVQLEPGDDEPDHQHDELT